MYGMLSSKHWSVCSGSRTNPPNPLLPPPKQNNVERSGNEETIILKLRKVYIGCVLSFSGALRYYLACKLLAAPFD